MRRAIVLCGLLMWTAAQAQTREPSWDDTVAQVVDAVVSLDLAYDRAFANESQGTSTATGFVVDAERGLILTNRHVVGLGPLSAHASFQNRERVAVVPVYRDPVHDFGLMRYDPEALQHTPPALELRSDKLRRGLEIRVLGSDGGEQLSILTGTVARVDRGAPRYGRYHYNDFNTFYAQAASSTSGGSSGSPVIDIDGDVVALNAGASTRTAASFFLPLPLVEDALASLQADETPARGGLAAVMRHDNFVNLARLGLQESLRDEALSANAEATGLLIVAQVLRGTPLETMLNEGDIVLSIDGRSVVDFVQLERLLAPRAGEEVAVRIWRDGQTLSIAAPVIDLHDMVPDVFVEFGDSVLHDMSLQQIRAMHIPQRGVMVADPGYLLTRAKIGTGTVITSINGTPVQSIDDFVQVLVNSRAGEDWRVRYIAPGAEHAEQLAQIEVLPQWFAMRRCERLELWQCSVLPDLVEAPVPRAEAPALDDALVGSYGDPLLDAVLPRVVRVEFDVPHEIDNVYANHFTGAGLLLDDGLIAVDRNTVPVSLGDARVTLFDTLQLPASVVFLHPLYNLALLQVDDALFDNVTLPPLLMSESEPVLMVGYDLDGKVMQQRVTQYSQTALEFSLPGVSRFQPYPIDAYDVANINNAVGGVLLGRGGVVSALWTSYAFESDQDLQEGTWGLPISAVQETVAAYQRGGPVKVPGFIPGYMPLADAVRRGLPREWTTAIVEASGAQRQVLFVREVNRGAPAAQALQVGDLVLAIDGEPVVRAQQIVREFSAEPLLMLTILRDGELIELPVLPWELPRRGTPRVVFWAGAYLQAPLWELGYQSSVTGNGVYVGFVLPGSPAARDGLYRNRFITQVDGQPVADLDAFLEIVGGAGSGKNLRLMTLYPTGHAGTMALRPDYHFWPTVELRHDGDQWRRQSLRER